MQKPVGYSVASKPTRSGLSNRSETPAKISVTVEESINKEIARLSEAIFDDERNPAALEIHSFTSYSFSATKDKGIRTKLPELVILNLRS